jgi:hypothetical protein
MTISPAGGTAQSYLSQLYSTQQAQAVSAVSPDVPAATGAPTTDASAGNSLTGTASSTLDSQTLQALLELTQQDPTGPSQQNAQTGQAQGAHHHRHHHGGAAPPAAATSTPATTAPDNATATADAEDADSSLESALLTA